MRRVSARRIISRFERLTQRPLNPVLHASLSFERLLVDDRKVPSGCHQERKADSAVEPILMLADSLGLGCFTGSVDHRWRASNPVACRVVAADPQLPELLRAMTRQTIPSSMRAPLCSTGATNANGSRRRVFATVDVAPAVWPLVETAHASYRAYVIAADPSSAATRLPADVTPDAVWALVMCCELRASLCLADRELQAKEGLTARECQVWKLLGGGASSDQIARSLGVTVHTARRHTERLYRKLQVSSRTAAARKYLLMAQRDDPTDAQG